jgi:hypothetical protein
MEKLRGRLGRPRHHPGTIRPDRRQAGRMDSAEKRQAAGLVGDAALVLG